MLTECVPPGKTLKGNQGIQSPSVCHPVCNIILVHVQNLVLSIKSRATVDFLIPNQTLPVAD